MATNSQTADSTNSITTIAVAVGSAVSSAAGTLRDKVVADQYNPHARFDGATHDSSGNDGVF